MLSYFLVLYGWSQSTSVLGKSKCAIQIADMLQTGVGYAFHLSDGVFSSFEDVRESKPRCGKTVKKGICKQKEDESKKVYFFGNNPLYLQMIA